MKKFLKKMLKIIGIILLVLLVIAAIVYFFVLNYPNLKNDPKVGKWYKVETSEMKSSDGSNYHAFFKKGNSNKVMVYFAGGGNSINEETAKYDTYNTRMLKPDYLANITMNMGGLASTIDGSPYSDYSIILFPYSTGDFHIGTGEFSYTDLDGSEKILYHNGYINFTEAMDMILEKAGIENAQTVVVTGYSAGAFGAGLLAEDVFTDYFPNASSKTVLVDAGVLLYDDWKYVVENVWAAPTHIQNRITSNNLILDSLTALYNDLGDDVNILFDCSTRDGDLATGQRYLNTLYIDEEGNMPVSESDGDDFQVMLKQFVSDLKEKTNANVFIFDGLTWYERPYNLTLHTVIGTPYVWQKLNDTDKSVAEWLEDTINGNKKDYGIELLDKTYESVSDGTYPYD